MDDKDEIIRQNILREFEGILSDKPLDFDQLKEVAPTLADQIEKANQVANQASSLDAEVGLPSTVLIHSDESEMAKNVTTSLDILSIPVFHQDDLKLYKNIYNQYSLAEARSIIAHEISHAILRRNEDGNNLTLVDEQDYAEQKLSQNHHSFETNDDVKFYLSKRKHEEFAADRGADAFGVMQALLKSTMLNDPHDYNAPSAGETHPNNRERIGAVLAEMYGNDVFKNSGSVSGGDGKFRPKLSENGLPVTEEGREITNWEKIDAAIQKQVALDLQLLDGMIFNKADSKPLMSKGQSDSDKEFDRLTPEEKNHFEQHVESVVTSFRKEYQPDYKQVLAFPNDDDINQQQLANSFRNADLNAYSDRVGLIKQDPQMIHAILAYHFASDHINASGLHPEAKQSTLVMTRENIAHGIERNEYLDFEKKERQTQQMNT